MTLILSIETATNICSVSLHENHNLLALKESFIAKSHSELVALFIKDILSESDKKHGDLDAVAISKGPGSYTGLRIGTSIAKGICYARDIPLIAINTLEAMALKVLNYNYANTILCPMIDARRMEVYTLLMNNKKEKLLDTSAKIIDEHSFDDILRKDKMLFFGNGAEKCKKVLGHQDNAYFIPGVNPSASDVGSMAYDFFLKNKFEDLAYFEPFYLKEFRIIKPKSKKFG